MKLSVWLQVNELGQRQLHLQMQPDHAATMTADKDKHAQTVRCPHRKLFTHTNPIHPPVSGE